MTNLGSSRSLVFIYGSNDWRAILDGCLQLLKWRQCWGNAAVHGKVAERENLACILRISWMVETICLIKREDLHLQRRLRNCAKPSNCATKSFKLGLSSLRGNVFTLPRFGLNKRLIHATPPLIAAVFSLRQEAIKDSGWSCFKVRARLLSDAALTMSN